MDEKNRKIDKIYSRNRLKIPKMNISTYECKSNKLTSNINPKKIKKIIKIFTILTIAFFVVNGMLKAVEPMMNRQCVTMAKNIATKISNEQATIVMADYKYEDLMNITRDDNQNIKMISANVITVNKIISDIPVLIQKELTSIENSKFYIKLGSFTGSKLLAGRGPDIEIKMSIIGDVETNLKSEFSSAGINQTLHRIYLEVKCNVIILTPFNTIEETITNQVLLAEGVIVGNIPDTYYNFNNLDNDNLTDVVK